MGEAPPIPADRIYFTDYLANDRRVNGHNEPIESKPSVFITADDGSDGRELLRAAVTMQAPTGYENIVIIGPQLDDTNFRTVAAQVVPGTQVRRPWPGLDSRIVEATAMTSVGDYNTVCEILVIDTPTPVVPHETPRLEQLTRTEAFRDARTLDVVRTSQVTTKTLRVWATDAVTRRVNRSHISRDGLAVTADSATDLLGGANPAAQEAVV